MKKNLKNYIKHYQGCISENICDDTITLLERNTWLQESYYDIFSNMIVNIDPGVKTVVEQIPTTGIVMSSIFTAIKKYVLEDNDISWFKGWSGFTVAKFNKYETGVGTNLKSDHNFTIFDGSRKGIPILTVVGFLNDNFKGGELCFWGEENYALNKGDVVIYPSIFLFGNQALPVTEGVKYDFISYVW